MIEVFRIVHPGTRAANEECTAACTDAPYRAGSLVVTAGQRPRLSARLKINLRQEFWVGVRGFTIWLQGYPPPPLNLKNHGFRHGLARKI